MAKQHEASAATSHTEAKSESAPKSYRILHTQVGPWPKGFVASEAQLSEHGVEVQRLLDLKAIEVVTDAPTGETPLNPDEVARQQRAKADEVGSVKDAAARGPVFG